MYPFPRIGPFAALVTTVMAAHASAQFIPDYGGRCAEERDDDGDGEPDYIAQYVYDDDSNRLLVERYDRDADGDWDVLAEYIAEDDLIMEVVGVEARSDEAYRRTYYMHDDQGRIRYVGFDTDDDGIIERSERFTYFGGFLSTIAIDELDDGDVDSLVALSFDEDGDLVRESLDEGADGSTDFEVRMAYLGGGRLGTREIDLDGDGEIDGLTLCLEDQRLLTTWCQEDHDADGVFDLVTQSRRNSAGALVEERTFPAPSPTETAHTRHAYEAGERHPLDDRFLGYIGRLDTAGLPTRTLSYEYDELGRLLSITTDEGSDGTTDSSVVYRYECDD